MLGDPDVTRDPTWLVRRLRPRTRLKRMLNRVRRYAPNLLLSAVAAGLAYALAALIFGSDDAVFAPIAAVVAVGISAGQRLVRAVEISLGVVLGLIMAVLLTEVIGSGAWQLSLAVLLALTAAVALRASGLMANQAAVAAVFVMVLVPLQDTAPLIRLGDAVIGGAVAVVLTALFGPDPHRVALSTAEDLLKGLATAYGRLAQALEKPAVGTAERVLADLESLEGIGGELRTAVAATRESISVAPSKARLIQRRRLRAIVQLADRAGLMVTSARSCARGAASLVRHGRRTDPQLVTALEELARTHKELARWVQEPTHREVVLQSTMKAAVTASALLRRPRVSPAGQALAWQIRAAAVDVLRVLGLSHPSAIAALEDAAGRTDQEPEG